MLIAITYNAIAYNAIAYIAITYIASNTYSCFFSLEFQFNLSNTYNPIL